MSEQHTERGGEQKAAGGGEQAVAPSPDRREEWDPRFDPMQSPLVAKGHVTTKVPEGAAGLKVRAIKRGYYEDVQREVDDEFLLRHEEDFSDVWMVKGEDIEAWARDPEGWERDRRRERDQKERERAEQDRLLLARQTRGLGPDRLTLDRQEQERQERERDERTTKAKR